MTITLTTEGWHRCCGCKLKLPLELFGKRKDRLPDYCRPCYRKHSTNWRLRNPEKQAQLVYRQNITKYGISIEQFEIMLQKQNGVCAICKLPESRTDHKRLSIDHNHATGKVRGLLCSRCNVVVGNAREKIDTLQAAIDYLKRHCNGGNEEKCEREDWE